MKCPHEHIDPHQYEAVYPYPALGPDGANTIWQPVEILRCADCGAFLPSWAKRQSLIIKAEPFLRFKTALTYSGPILAGETA